MQSLRHQNTVQDTVHLNMIFEDAGILHSNPLIKEVYEQFPEHPTLSSYRTSA